ncbi:hypothetical protein [Aliarcobacter butzleri]|uniref:hypothetical protein n=1 Tax=Aliarcobacter butzleri TaxID=28197 RepID=UPI00126A2BBF|nr:hypothetical protein [Aliarcobacter butzleri]
MGKYTQNDIDEAVESGSFGLEGYAIYQGMLYSPEFFNDKEKTVTLSRIKNVRGSGYKCISYEDLFERCTKLTTKEARERYPNIVL